MRRAARVESAEAAIRALREQAPTSLAIVDRPSQALARLIDSMAEPGGGDPAEIVAAESFSFGRDWVSFSIAVPDIGIVVVNDAFQRGWQARVDGVRTDVYRVNGLVRGITLDEGAHEVRMEFLPWDGVVLRWVMLGTLGLCLVILVAAAAGRKRG
jgi:hypothetical protein